MKILEIRIAVSDLVTDEVLNEIGQEMQTGLPVDLVQNGLNVNDVTFELKKPTDNFEVRMPPAIAYAVERRLMDLARIQRERQEATAKKTRNTLRQFRGAIGILHPVFQRIRTK